MQYPTYVSPDGRQQVAGTRSREVELRHRGWRQKQPVKTTNPPKEQPKDRGSE